MPVIKERGIKTSESSCQPECWWGLLFFNKFNSNWKWGMKNVLTLITISIFFSTVVVTQASAGCVIQWWGYFYLEDVSGSAPTAETTRTQQATYEAFVNMFNTEPQDWSNGCYNWFDQNQVGPCEGFYYHACQNGTWSDGQPYCVHKGSGNWDVICEQTKCSTWANVIEKYNAYTSGEAMWSDFIVCYQQYTSQ
jgi:hypothetical protein